MIVLIGFMGAGKTEVGALVASRLGLALVDTDALVEARAGRTVPEIFSSEGESAFRARERSAVQEALSGREAVIALGGGAPCDPEVRRAIAGHTVVHLAVGLEEALRRAGDPARRPMLAAGDPDGLYAQRAPLYASAADIEVITDGKTPGEIADEVCAALGSVTAGLRRVAVPAPSRSYEVVVGEGIAPAAAELAPAPGAAEKCFVITHPSLSDVAGKVAASYEGAGLAAHVLTVPEGESSKSLDVAAKLFAGLAEAQAHRGDLVAGVGGGVITDLAGFVASTYARGMQVVAVPTTLLAQVDAAIGGKTGVNLPHGKNLVGTIHQPAAVLCDVAALRTLPAPEMRSGLAEVAKYGFIRDPVLVRSLAADARAIAAADPGVLIRTVVRCAGIKASVVAADEREAGLRRILNYGHTFGHAIEAARSYEGIRHGEAVAIGMVAAAYLAELLGLAGPGLAELHEETLRPLGLPVRASLDGAALERAWRRDKKFERGVRFVLLEELGRPVAGVTAPRATVMEAIERVSE